MANDRPPDGEPPARQPGYRPPDNRPTPAQQQQFEPAASRLSLDVSPRYIRLQPGEVVTATIKVRNMGPVVDEITLTPRGEAGAWITIAPDTLNIYPSTEAEATIRFAPPRASRPPAGLFAFEIAVNSDRQPDSSTVYRGSVELGSYDNLSAAAAGSTYVTGRRDAILPIKVRNLGNRPTNVQVSAADLPGAAVLLSAPVFALEPGGEATVWATIRPKSGFMSGPPRQFPFTISVRSDYSAPLTIDGRMEQQARFSRKRLVLIGVAAAALLTVGGGLAANAFGLLPLTATGPTPTPNVTASLTPTSGPTGTAATASPGESGVIVPTPTAAPDATPTPTEETPTASPTPSADPFAGWEDLGGDFGQGPAITSWGADQLDIFAPWSDEAIRQRTWNGTDWSSDWVAPQPQALTKHKPSAVDWAPNHIDLFATLDDGTDPQGGNVGWQTFDSGVWNAWQALPPGILRSGPAATSWGPGFLAVFGQGTDNMLYQSSYNGVWTSWFQPLSIEIKNAPAAVSWGSASTGGLDQIDVFVLNDTDDQYHWLRFDGDPMTNLGNWQDMGKVGGNKVLFNSAPAVSSWSPTEFDVFGRDSDGMLRHSTFNGVNWTDWEQLTTFTLGNAPGAVAWGSGRIDVAVTDDNGGMHHSWLENGVWNPPAQP